MRKKSELKGSMTIVQEESKKKMKYNFRFYVLLINTFNSRKPWQRFAWLKTPLDLSLKEKIKIKIQDVLLQLFIIIMLWNRNFLVPYPVCNGITGTKFCMGCTKITFFSRVTALPQKKPIKLAYSPF